MQTKTAKRSLELVPEIIRRLEAGEIIILPTDTSYALVGHAFNQQALAEIQKLKRWNSPQPLAIFTRQEKAHQLGVINPDCEKMMSHFPYPVTLIVQKKDIIPPELTGNLKSLLLTCPDEFIYELVARVPFPMAATSATWVAEVKAKNFAGAMRLYEGEVPLIVDGGQSKYGTNGTLIDFTVEKPTILKYGTVSVDDLRPIIPDIVLPSHLMK